MDIINVIIIGFFVVFLAFEGKEALKGYKAHINALKQVEANKVNVVVVKDYLLISLIYAAVAVFLIVYGVIYIRQNNYLYGISFFVLSIFCAVFIIESVALKTVAFYDSGFLFSGKTYKYKNISKIYERKRFFRGYQVKMMQEEDIYLTTKAKTVLVEKMNEYKNRKKSRA